MKKHIFGVLLFSSIVGSFVLVFGFIYAPPNLEIEEVKRPYLESEQGATSQNGIKYQVQSVQYDLDTGKLISRIRLNWSGQSSPPKELWINAMISNDQKKSSTSFPADVVREPFKNRNSVIVTSETPVSSHLNVSREDNYYASFAVSDNPSSIHFSDFSEMPGLLRIPVLFVHGERSKIDR